MQAYEYKVIPAPRRGEKTRAARSVPERFAHALTQAMNDQARDGWEYLRADTLPCDERVGLTGTATHFQNMLVFRRALSQPVSEPVQMPSAVVQPVMSHKDPEPDATLIVPLAPYPAEGAAPALGPAMFSVRPNGKP